MPFPWNACKFAASVTLFCPLFLLGCGGSGSSNSKVNSSTPPPASTLAVSANTPKVSAAAGGSPVTLSLTVTGSSGQVNVTATGAPAGVAISPVTLSGGTASVSITVSTSAAPGTYTLTFTATDATQQTQTVIISLTIAAAAAPPPPPQAPGYSLSISGPSQLPQGGTATATLTANYVGGFDSNVSVAPVFLPTGVSITSGPIVFTSANLSQTITFAASASTSLATYPVVLTGTGGNVDAQSVSFSLSVVAPPPPPASYVYITTPAGINAYAAPGQGAALSLITGSPFQVTGTVIGSAGLPYYNQQNGSPQYLVTRDGTSIYTYSIAANGALGPQVSTINTQSYGGNACGGPINAVTSGQLVYVGLGNTTTPTCYANQTFNVSTTGLLTFLGSTELDKPVTLSPPVFSGLGANTFYAYGMESPAAGACEDAVVGYTTEANGALNLGSNGITLLPAAQQGSTFAVRGPMAAATAQDGLVAMVMYQETGPCGTVQPAQLGLFSLEYGNLTSTLQVSGSAFPDPPVQTYENMPVLTGTPAAMAFALNGNFTIPLAVGGTGGLQVYSETLLEGNTQAIPEAPAILSANLISTPITQVAWDLNNLYAFNGQQLYVFYSIPGFPGSIPNTLSTGAPFAISGSNMVVVPISLQ
jgi:hypothetical protein